MNLFTHKTKPFTVAILILISTAQLSAQESNDLEGWSAVQIDIKATEKLSFSVAEHLRYKNDVSILSTYFTNLKHPMRSLKILNWEVAFGLLKKMII